MAHYLTKTGLADLQKELHKIVEEDLPNTLAAISQAREEGDLKENAGYQTALKVKDELTTRQQEIEEILKDYEIIEESTTKGNSTVNIGNRVKLLFVETKEEMEIFIVGASEANLLENKISNESPLVQAILEKAIGEEVSYKSPNGEVKVKILEIF